MGLVTEVPESMMTPSFPTALRQKCKAGRPCIDMPLTLIQAATERAPIEDSDVASRFGGGEMRELLLGQVLKRVWIRAMKAWVGGGGSGGASFGFGVGMQRRERR